MFEYREFKEIPGLEFDKISQLDFSILSGQLLNCLCIKGTAIGKCPKNKLYRGYIELELQLREFERCRILYEKFLEFGPENCTSWMKVHAYLLQR